MPKLLDLPDELATRIFSEALTCETRDIVINQGDARVPLPALMMAGPELRKKAAYAYCTTGNMNFHTHNDDVSAVNYWLQTVVERQRTRLIKKLTFTVSLGEVKEAVWPENPGTLTIDHPGVILRCAFPAWMELLKMLVDMLPDALSTVEFRGRNEVLPKAAPFKHGVGTSKSCLHRISKEATFAAGLRAELGGMQGAKRRQQFMAREIARLLRKRTFSEMEEADHTNVSDEESSSSAEDLGTRESRPHSSKAQRVDTPNDSHCQAEDRKSVV